MERRILSLFIAITVFVTAIPVISVSADTDITADFTDPEFLQYVYDLIGKTPPSPIYDTDVSGISELVVAEKGIESLDGIEHFPALTGLWCGGNQLTSLDVSNNTALTSLWCFSNQLTNLDVSNNTALKYLSCFENKLTSLDVSNNKALKDLWCNNNQLTSLDVSNNKALQCLACFENKLTSLDVSNNRKLRLLQCNNNQLTSLDVSNNRTLEESLNCSYNNMKNEAAVIGFKGIWDNNDFKFLPQNDTPPSAFNPDKIGSIATAKQIFIYLQLCPLLMLLVSVISDLP